MIEKFSIPCAGAIIEKEINNNLYILMQERHKENKPQELGLLEIPAGKIRENENIFDCIKREIKEETGLNIVDVKGKENSSIYRNNGYEVIDFSPYHCTQNLIGNYPVILMVFICQTTGKLLSSSNESKNYKWISIAELKTLVEKTPEKIYPMDLALLHKFINDKSYNNL
ncbi:NUDIX hydrolase [Miniphocaeibacter massiliensis]|uniref:NUDIX hydrolase n=1 Tax=Miniphocaeibacter massiliensis TaxID=2041841 RepID=UPI001A9366E2|nr:NUDIX domain-containing protein [Miniphocaeibacter massiliensis]